MSQPTLPPPILTPGQAHLAAGLLTLSYVGGLYISRIALVRSQRLKNRRRRQRETETYGQGGHSTSREKNEGNSVRKVNGNRNRSAVGGSSSREERTPLPDLIEYEGSTCLASEEEEEEENATNANELDRDHPVTIKSRLRAVTISTCLGLGLVVGLVAHGSFASGSPISGPHGFGAAGMDSGRISRVLRDSFRLLGLSPVSVLLSSPASSSTVTKITMTLLPYLLAPTLFLGPLYCAFLDQELPWQRWGRGWALFDLFRLFSLSSRRGQGSTGRGGSKNGKERRGDQANADADASRWIELRNYVAVSGAYFLRPISVSIVCSYSVERPPQ